jgi:GTPase SAR1 family protein
VKNNEGGRIGGRREGRTRIGEDGKNAPSSVIEAKIVLAGDMAVGKSSLAGRFNQGKFNDIY